jgi:hypothetical protein
MQYLVSKYDKFASGIEQPKFSVQSIKLLDVNISLNIKFGIYIYRSILSK